MATNVSDGDLRKLVAKDSDDRLRREIKLAQPHLDPTEVDQMGREDMVSLVTKLRKLAGVTTSLKDPVLHAATLELPVSHSSASRIDPMEAMMQMIAMMKAERDAQAVRDERLAQVAQEKEARLAAERAEERELEVRKLEVAKLEHERLMALIRQQNEDRIIAARETRLATEEANRIAREAKEAADARELVRVAEVAEAERRHRELRDDARAAREAAEVRNNGREARLKRAADVMKGCLYKFPSEALEIPVWVEHCTRTFEANHIAEDLRLALVNPYLSDRARRVVTKLPVEATNTYARLTQALLSEFRLTPAKYRESFIEARKGPDESNVQFGTRLMVLWRYYINSRNVNEDYGRLMELIIADKLKDSLPYAARDYVRAREGAEVYDSQRVAQLADLYINDHPNVERNSQHSNKSFSRNQFRPKNCEVRQTRSASPQKDRPRFSSSHGRGQNSSQGKQFENRGTVQAGVYTRAVLDSGKKQDLGSGGFRSSSTIRCWTCDEVGHSRNQCPRNRSSGQTGIKQIHEISLRAESAVDELSRSPVTGPRPVCSDREPVDTHGVYRLALTGEEGTAIGDQSRNGEPPGKVLLPVSNCLELDLMGGVVSGLLDTGAMISVLSPDCVAPDVLVDRNYTGNIFVESALGERTLAKLYDIPVRLNRGVDNPCPYIVINCAVTTRLAGAKCLISLADYRALATVVQLNNHNPDNADVDGFETPKKGDVCEQCAEYQCHNLVTNLCDELLDRDVSCVSVSALVDQAEDTVERPSDRRVAECTAMVQLQSADPSLNICRAHVRDDNTSQFFLRSGDGMLFRRVTMNNYVVTQLVVPKDKRLEIMKVGHDAPESGHYGSEKTLQRIEQSFHWPGIRRDVRDFVRSCAECQRRKRVTVLDRVPITPIVRPASPFDVCHTDLIGPIDPTSTKQFKYILVFIDACTRFCECVPLKSLTAQETCRALMSIFHRYGIPRVVVCDNGTNYAAAVTQEMLKHLGIEVRFTTPLHSEANGLCERANQSIEKLLHHTLVSDKPRAWADDLSACVYAYNTVPNSTTSLTPFEMLYGRPARGPLQVLRETWANEGEGLPMLSKSNEQYMSDLRGQFEMGARIAEERATVAQGRYAAQYNRRARDKTFDVGDEVLILIPDDNRKLTARWQGPAIIDRVMSPYSFSVALCDGSKRVLHANRLRKFITRVSALGVIFEDDEDFGDLEMWESVVISDEPTAADKIKTLDLSHLSCTQQDELRSVLLRHAEVFSDVPGHCNILEHDIKLEPGFRPNPPTPYRVPHKLQPEVARQMSDLLGQDRIEVSTSDFAHPIVCVIKKNGEVRVCCDFRHVNSATVMDRYPMPHLESLLDEISPANWISSLDCTAGYWQIGLKPEAREKTAFVTDSGLFQWKVLPFGLKCAASTYQRVADIILAPHRAYARGYIDDASVFSVKWTDHLVHLDAVLHAFQDAGMTLRLTKCEFGKRKLKFLGFKIGSGEKGLLPERVEVLKTLVPPTSKKGLRSALGMLGFFRSFIPHFAEIAAPLTDMTKGCAPSRFVMNEEQLKSFNLLKDVLSSDEVLVAPNYSKPFKIYSDASDHSVGACLTQEYNGFDRPIAFVSSKFSDTQKRWSTIEKESFAIIFALRKFDCIVFGHRVEVYSDHNPLHYLASGIPKSAKLTRWALALQRYDLKISHYAGKLNRAADFLSRL